MSILKVAKLGNPVLRQISKPVPKEAIKGHTIQRLIKDMIATMREYGGVGLAAPQVHESVQIAVIEGLEGTRQGKQKPTQLQVLINPTLTVVSDELVEEVKCHDIVRFESEHLELRENRSTSVPLIFMPELFSMSMII